MLTEKQHHDYQNYLLRYKLFHLENRSILEEILVTEQMKLQRLQKAKNDGKIRLSKKIEKQRELGSLFAEVKTEVDSFLDVIGVSSPEVVFPSFRDNALLKKAVYTAHGFAGLSFGLLGLTLAMGGDLDRYQLFLGILSASTGLLGQTSRRSRTYYDDVGIKIYLERVPREMGIPYLSHEYTHYLQHQLLFSPDVVLPPENLVFIEGHARGVQRYISQIYNQREGNDLFLWVDGNFAVSELKSVYSWMCRKSGKRASPFLVLEETEYDKTCMRYFLNQGEPSPHALGNSLMLIHEAQHGPGIYRQMLHGEYIF